MDELLDIIGRSEGPLAYLILALCAAIEYVFPPFPGDTVTLFGAFLITARGWNGAGVMAVVTAGSLVGAWIDYLIGRRLASAPDTPPRTWLGRYWQRSRLKLLPLVERLRHRGASFIVINRFLPGVRALFFVAAGMAGLPLWRVMFWGALSAILWNAMIIAVGASLGASWERLRGLFEVYSTVVWIIMVVFGAALLVRWWRRRTGDGDEES